MCEALTCIFAPCNRQTEGTTGLCFEHQDHYNQDKWIHDWITHPKRGNTVLLGHQKGSVMRNLEDHIRYATKTGKVRIPETCIRNLPALPRYTGVFLLLCENDYIDPKWNKKLLRLCIAENLKRMKGVFAGFWPNIHETLHSLITNPHMGYTLLFAFYTEVVIKLAKQAKVYSYYKDIDFGYCIGHFLGPDNIDSESFGQLLELTTLASKEFLASLAKCKDEASKELYYDIVYPIIEPYKYSIRQQLKEEADDLKREIVENVYHPRNVERWLETGGWELLEMMT